MSGLAQVNPYFFELLAFIYWLAARFKRLSEKIKIEKEIRWLCAMEKVQFVQVPGDHNKWLFTAIVENYIERGMGEGVLLNFCSIEYWRLQVRKGI